MLLFLFSIGIEQLRHASNMFRSHMGNEYIDILSILSEQSKTVTRILNDVLSMQKIEENKLVLEYAPFSLGNKTIQLMQTRIFTCPSASVNWHLLIHFYSFLFSFVFCCMLNRKYDIWYLTFFSILV